MTTPTFLTAEWRKLAIANYEVDKSLLESFVPAGTELDTWNTTCYISLVGFMFMNTKLKGYTIPCHANFEEVNLRFYVRFNDNGLWKRGVVFIKEIVPKPAVTMVANRLYKENYQTMAMGHQWTIKDGNLEVEYKWKKQSWNSFSVTAIADEVPMIESSEEEFITEHYWGYKKISSSLTSQYEVQHPRWNVYPVEKYAINVDFNDIYGQQFSFLSHQKPRSVMLAEGSAIAVKAGTRILHDRQFSAF